ncbi:MAG: HD domain-containing protein [Defluviitaleaceae bacterium]|nr:HD domain-containing protein [Defluviitaleaceae bacterium]
MQKDEYSAIEGYMKEKMQDAAHDTHHIYRVLNGALDIANHETGIDLDVLIAACLLHDIGREDQFKNPALCHAQVGAKMAYEYLIARGWSQEKALCVKDCIAAHRYRSNATPQSIEAKILFDADKLEATGLIGIARTLIYQGIVAMPLYVMDDGGEIISDYAPGEDEASFIQEYNFKLKNIYEVFYTNRAKEIAISRQQAAIDFYSNLYNEITQSHHVDITKHLG